MAGLVMSSAGGGSSFYTSGNESWINIDDFQVYLNDPGW